MKLLKWGIAGALLLALSMTLNRRIQDQGLAWGDPASMDSEVEEHAASTRPPGALVRAPKVVGFGHVDVDGGTIPLTVPNVGRVAEVLVNEGDRVEANAPLVRLDDTQARARLAQAEANVDQAKLQFADAERAPELFEFKKKMQAQSIHAAQTRLDAAKQELKRLEELVRTNVAPIEKVTAARERMPELDAALEVEKLRMQELELEQPDRNLKLAQAALRAAEAQRDLAQEFLNSHTLYAPMAGVVLRVMVNPGQVLSQNATAPALWFCPDRPRIVRCEIDEEFASRVQAGMKAEIHSDDASSPVWSGTVLRCADWIAHRRSLLDEPFQRNDVRTLECIVAFDDVEAAPRIGRRMRVVLFDAPGDPAPLSPVEGIPAVKEPLADAKR